MTRPIANSSAIDQTSKLISDFDDAAFPVNVQTHKDKEQEARLGTRILQALKVGESLALRKDNDNMPEFIIRITKVQEKSLKLTRLNPSGTHTRELTLTFE